MSASATQAVDYRRERALPGQQLSMCNGPALRHSGRWDPVPCREPSMQARQPQHAQVSHPSQQSHLGLVHALYIAEAHIGDLLGAMVGVVEHAPPQALLLKHHRQHGDAQQQAEAEAHAPPQLGGEGWLHLARPRWC